MEVLVLEDTLQHQLRMEAALNEIARELGKKIEVKVTGKIRELEEYIEADSLCHLYFLDIDIKGEEKKGLDIAQLIRAHNPYAVIVFVTSHSEFATLTYSYKVSALDFIEKELGNACFKKRVKDCVEYTLSHLIENEQTVDFFEYDFKGSKFSIPFRDIYYIETAGGAYKLRVVGKSFAKEFRGTIKDIQTKPENQGRFFESHKSYLVNIDQISGFDKKTRDILLYEGVRVPYGRNKFKNLKHILEEKEKSLKN